VKPRICLVSDRHRLSPASDPAESLARLVTFVGAAARAGVDMIQLRERDLDARDLAALTVRCIDEAAGHAPVLVNDRLDVAVAARAQGVHLRSDSVDGSAARALAPPDFLIGRSVHGTAEAVEAGRGGSLDYVFCGTIFPTASKPAGHQPSGLAMLASVCAAVPIPVVAIGGITLERVEGAVRSGAAGVAAIGLFVPPRGVPFERHLAETVNTLRQVFDTCGALP
jgi:thiamine-phosphate pyrophosphorylase